MAEGWGTQATRENVCVFLKHAIDVVRIAGLSSSLDSERPWVSQPCSSSQLRRDQERFQAASAWRGRGGPGRRRLTTPCAAPAPRTAPPCDAGRGGRHVARGRPRPVPRPRRPGLRGAASPGRLSLGDAAAPRRLPAGCALTLQRNVDLVIGLCPMRPPEPAAALVRIGAGVWGGV